MSESYIRLCLDRAGVFYALRPAESSLRGAAAGDHLTIRVGTAAWNVPLRSARRRNDLFSGSIQLDAREHLSMPLMAILTSGRLGAPQGNLGNFRAIARTGLRRGVLVAVLTPDGLSDDPSFVSAHLPESHGWTVVRIPKPTVVYNRVPTRQAEQSSAVLLAKRRLARRGIPLFNPAFFQKDELYRWLTRNAEVRTHVPETVPMKGPQDVVEAVRRHPVVYVKPVSGKAGNRMMRVARREGRYELVFQADGKRTRSLHDSALSVSQACARNAGRVPYVLQQGIDLARVEKQMFDCRLLLQKDKDLSWNVVGMGIRVAPLDGITTHVPNGGHIRNASETLTACFGARAHEIEQAVLAVAQRSAAQVEASASGLVAEMSMDIGLDRSGKPWVFEANAKPMKFDEPDIRKRSLNGLIDLAQVLSGFSPS